MKGISIDEAGLPEWARKYFTPGQLTLDRGLQWVLLVYKSRKLKSSARSVAQRLYVHTLGRARKVCNPSEAGLAADLDLSPTTVGNSLDALGGDGWLLARRNGPAPSTYGLAWPLEDVLTAEESSARCGAATRKGGVCTRRAGRGTATPGMGPCSLHGGEPAGGSGGEGVSRASEPADEPQPLEVSEVEPALEEPQPLEVLEQESAPDEPQRLEFSAGGESTKNPNRWSQEPQRLEPRTPTAGERTPAVGDEYVESKFLSEQGVRTSGSRRRRATGGQRAGVAEGAFGATGNSQPTIPAPRPASEPARRPRRSSRVSAVPTSMTARSVVAAVPRYRDPAVKPWFKQALVRHVDAALAAGFGREAIIVYAGQVIGEGSYAPHQHVPELRGALRRLACDVKTGSTCRTCAGAPTDCACGRPDKPWTDEDTAQLEQALDRIGASPDERDACQELAATGTGA